MSTTIELDRSKSSVWRVAGYCALALTTWFGSLIVAAWAFEPTRIVMVVAPDSRAALASIVQADVDLLDVSGSIVTVAGRSSGFVHQLYAAGAWFVLPLGEGGCGTPVARRVAQAS
jgi:hypothetical protein